MVMEEILADRFPEGERQVAAMDLCGKRGGKAHFLTMASGVLKTVGGQRACAETAAAYMRMLRMRWNIHLNGAASGRRTPGGGDGLVRQARRQGTFKPWHPKC